MSIPRSDNFFYTNPKPAQDFERKFVDPNYVDWASAAEVNAALEIAFRKNKYFWIAGNYYECDNDGVTYRQISGGGSSGGMQSAKIAIEDDASTIDIPALSGKTLSFVISNGTIFQDFVDNGNMISLSGITLDMTNAGGLFAGGYLIVVYY